MKEFLACNIEENYISVVRTVISDNGSISFLGSERISILDLKEIREESLPEWEEHSLEESLVEEEEENDSKARSLNNAYVNGYAKKFNDAESLAIISNGSRIYSRTYLPHAMTKNKHLKKVLPLQLEDSLPLEIDNFMVRGQNHCFRKT